MTTKRVLTDVPGNDVDQLVQDFIDDGCTASKEKQSNGLWTVTAICPDNR
ncbi:hypothetical protein [Geotalea sp. SG265]|nr:hypothetical protein [Geotalea sp. SG265]